MHFILQFNAFLLTTDFGIQPGRCGSDIKVDNKIVFNQQIRTGKKEQNLPYVLEEFTFLYLTLDLTDHKSH